MPLKLKFKVKQEMLVTLSNPKMYPYANVAIHTLNNIYDPDTIFQGLKPEVKVTMTQKPYVTLYNPKMYPQTTFGIPISNNIGDTFLVHRFVCLSVCSYFHHLCVIYENFMLTFLNSSVSQ